MTKNRADKSATAPVRAVIYSRISADKEGREEGVARQEADCQAFAERMGYVIVATFRDNDISASTRSTTPRPQYNEMMASARAGEFDVILAYSNSRLTRRPREFEDLIDLHERHGIQIHTVASGNFDLATADGRRMARFLAGEATAEAERTGERVARAKEQAAVEGRFRGGQRPYGFERDGMTLRSSEAKVIREATRAVLAGRSLASIARDLNQRGLQAERLRTVKDAEGRRVLRKDGTPKMKPVKVDWTYARLKDVLVRPRNAGLLAHGVPGRKPDARRRGRRYELEIVGDAKWPAILPREEWQAAVDTLTDPSRRDQNGNEVRWLGSGIYRCARPTGELDANGDPILCGGTLRPAPSRGKPLYRCVASAHLTIAAERTDEHVRDVVALKLNDRRLVERLTARLQPTPNPDYASDSEKIKKIERDLDRYLIAFEAEEILPAQLKQLTARANAKMAELLAHSARTIRRTASATILYADNPGQAFLDAATPLPDADGKLQPNPQLDIARAVLSSVITVDVLPQPHRGVQWTSARLDINLTTDTV